MTQEMVNDIKGFITDNIDLLKGATITMVSGRKYELRKEDVSYYSEQELAFPVMYHGDDGIEYLNHNFIESFKINLFPED